MKSLYLTIALLLTTALIPLLFIDDLFSVQQRGDHSNSGWTTFRAPGSVRDEIFILLHQNNTLSVSSNVEGCKVKLLEFNFTILHISSGRNWTISGEIRSSRLILPIFKAPLEGVYKVSLDISVLGKGECTVSVDSSIASGDKQGFLAFYSICSIVGFVGLGVVMVYAVWLRVKAS